MSKLIVEVCKIEKVENLPNADRMQMATIKGWNCLIQKDSYKEGELAIFIPPDAVLPEQLIETLQLTYLKGNNRIRTVKLRGYISQGLIISTDIIPNYNAKVGDDVAKELGITKYEPPVICGTPKKDTFFTLWAKYQAKEITTRRFVAKVFALVRDYFKPKRKVNPNFDVYTDMDNIKHYPNVFEEGESVVITEKIHGTNFRAGTLPLNETVMGRIKQFFTKQTHEFCYGSHRVQKSAFSGKGFYGEDVYGQIAQRYNLKDIIPADYIIYGEIYGPKIQELTYNTKQLEVVFFDVKYQGKYLDYDEFARFCQERNLPRVPVLYYGPYQSSLLKFLTEGNSVLATHHLMQNDITGDIEVIEKGVNSHIREGCIVKPIVEVNHPRVGRKMLKSISAEYLLTKKQDNPEEVIDDNPEYSH